MPESILFFAAGFGTRMRHLTRDLPKPLVPLAGRPMIDHAIDLAHEAGVRNMVANAHYLAPKLEQALAPRGIRISLETGTILDTGGGLRAALPLLGQGPVFTMNSDALWLGPNPLALLRDAWRPTDMDALLMLIPPAHASEHAGQGDFIAGPDGRLSRGPGAIFGGAQIIDPTQAQTGDAAAFSLNVTWDDMIARRRLFGIEYPGTWCDIGTPEGLAHAETLLAGRDV